MVWEDEILRYFKALGAEMIIPLNAKGKVNGLLVLLGEKMTMTDFLESEKTFTILMSLWGSR